MLIFIIAIGAGFATPYVEPHIKKLVASIQSDFPLDEADMRVLTFLALMVGVGILAIGSAVSPLIVLLGGGLGMFGKRLFEFAKTRASK